MHPNRRAYAQLVGTALADSAERSAEDQRREHIPGHRYIWVVLFPEENQEREGDARDRHHRQQHQAERHDRTAVAAQRVAYQRPEALGLPQVDSALQLMEAPGEM